jgi:hypothetical protein
MKKSYKRILIYILSSPFLLLFILVDIIKFPLVLFLMFPIWIIMATIDWLKGDKFDISIMWEASIILFLIWKDMVADND